MMCGFLERFNLTLLWNAAPFAPNLVEEFWENFGVIINDRNGMQSRPTATVCRKMPLT
jgi:hypothetical protein